MSLAGSFPVVSWRRRAAAFPSRHDCRDRRRTVPLGLPRELLVDSIEPLVRAQTEAERTMRRKLASVPAQAGNVLVRPRFSGTHYRQKIFIATADEPRVLEAVSECVTRLVIAFSTAWCE